MSLTKNELAEFKAQLLKMRNEIMYQLDNSKKEVTSGTDSTSFKSQHPADSGTEVAQQSTNLSVSNLEMATLKQIEHALKRIEEGTYGICEDTAVEIPLKRLQVLPLATRTAQAKGAFDSSKKYKDLY